MIILISSWDAAPVIFLGSKNSKYCTCHGLCSLITCKNKVQKEGALIMRINRRSSHALLHVEPKSAHVFIKIGSKLFFILARANQTKENSKLLFSSHRH